MHKDGFNRRILLTATTALGAAGLERADLILVRTDAPNIAPIGDPYDALVQLAQPSNIDTVVADGRIMRRNGQFTALDHEKIISDASDAVADLKTRAKWPS